MTRGLTLGLLAVAFVLALIPIGRWERTRHAHEEVRGMRSMLTQIGSLNAPQLHAYRYLSTNFECLLYRRGTDPYVLEVCFDSVGRVFETIDRRREPPRISSLREDPTRSTIRIDRSLATKLLHSMGVPTGLLVPAPRR